MQRTAGQLSTLTQCSCAHNSDLQLVLKVCLLLISISIALSISASIAIALSVGVFVACRVCAGAELSRAAAVERELLLQQLDAVGKPVSVQQRLVAQVQLARWNEGVGVEVNVRKVNVREVGQARERQTERQRVSDRE